MTRRWISWTEVNAVGSVVCKLLTHGVLSKAILARPVIGVKVRLDGASKGT